MELIGAMINGSFLLAIAVNIALETIPRFISPVAINAPGVTFIVVAAVGLGINVLGAVVFALTGRGHSHAHAHGGAGSPGDVEVLTVDSNDSEAEEHDHDHHNHQRGGGGKHVDLNVWAMFLHFLGDALSSLFVLATALLVFFFPAQNNKWVEYIDPAFSLVVVIIILWTSIPLVRAVARVLLQSTSDDLNLAHVTRTLSKIEGVLSVHDVHVWELVDGMAIASLHVDLAPGSDFTAISSKMKHVLHAYGIHSATIQPEFVSGGTARNGGGLCLDMCVDSCSEDWCCRHMLKSTSEQLLPVNSAASRGT